MFYPFIYDFNNEFKNVSNSFNFDIILVGNIHAIRYGSFNFTYRSPQRRLQMVIDSFLINDCAIIYRQQYSSFFKSAFFCFTAAGYLHETGGETGVGIGVGDEAHAGIIG